MVVYTSKHVRNNFETKAPNTDLASALNSSFDLGLDSFKHQLVALWLTQYHRTSAAVALGAALFGVVHLQVVSQKLLQRAVRRYIVKLNNGLSVVELQCRVQHGCGSLGLKLQLSGLLVRALVIMCIDKIRILV